MNWNDLRAQFPILHHPVRGNPLIYLDNAATTQKPKSVIDATKRYYEFHNANVHRGVHWLSEVATQEFEAAREKVRRFLNAEHSHEIIFVRGTTEGINLVAHSFGRLRFREGDEILISGMEHHSNIVPWQMLCEQTGARLVVAPVTDDGEIDLEQFAKRLGPKTKLVALVHVSNALGTINPIKEMVQLARAQNIPVLVDGAQATAHVKIDVRDLDCDFYVLSGHKMYGPTGIGVLYGKTKWLEAMPPWQGGGDMILKVSFEKTIYNRLPYKFEAGTPDMAGAIGLGAAVDFLQSLPWDEIEAQERELLEYGTKKLSEFKGLCLIGTARKKSGVLSFVLSDVHPHDIGTIMDQSGVAIRTGHHCAQPLMERMGVPATARASLGIYNRKEDIDALVSGLNRVREVFR